MAKEIKILIPDSLGTETVDIKVLSGGKEMLHYKQEVFVYNENETGLNRAEFVKKEIDAYSKEYTLVEIGLYDENHIPVLFRSSVENI